MIIAKSLHSDVGPSSAERWWNCSGSVAATRNIPEQKSMYAIIGTAAHSVTEWARLQNKPTKTFLGEKVVVEWGNQQKEIVIVDKEMVVATQEFVDYVESLKGIPHIELMINYGKWVGGGFGTSDDIRLDSKLTYVTDFKYGTGHKVYAKENKQLMLYALGTYAKFKAKNIKRFELGVHQPRLGHLDTWTIKTPTLLEWANDELIPAGKRVLEPDAPIKAGEWCTFCRIRETCRVRAESILLNPVEEFKNLDEAIDDISVMDIRQPLHLTNDEIARILPLKSIVVNWYSQLETYALRELSKGNAVGDHKVVEGPSHRLWNEGEEDVQMSLELEGVPPEEIFTRKIISPAKAEEHLGKKNKVLQSMILKPPGAPTLVPGSDPRPAIKVDPASEFKNLDSPDAEFN